MAANKRTRVSEIWFRYRHWVLLLILGIGFWVPWQRGAGEHLGNTWLLLAGALARTQILHITASITAVMSTAIFFALLAALLRTWAAASPWTWDAQTTPAGDQNVEHRSYRYARNMRYAGLWLHTLALSILMPPGGALFAVIGVTVWAVTLLRLEEQRFFQQRGPGGGLRTRWGSAFLSQLYFWGACLTYVAFGDRYNTTFLEQGVLISFGTAILIQGLRTSNRPPAAE